MLGQLGKGLWENRKEVGFNLPYRFIGINQGVTKANIGTKKKKLRIRAEDQKI